MRAEPMTFFFSLYGEIYPDNLLVFTPAVSPTLTPQPRLPPPPPKNLVVIHNKTWSWSSSVTTWQLNIAWHQNCAWSKETEESCLLHCSSKTTYAKTLTVEKYSIHNSGKGQWKVNNFTSEIKCKLQLNLLISYFYRWISITFSELMEGQLSIGCRFDGLRDLRDMWLVLLVPPRSS